MLSFSLILVDLLGAYLMGSVCSAVIVAKLFHLPDPRTEGSQNPGATNMLRLAGKKYAAIVLLTDVLKGTLPLVFAHLLNTPATLLGFTCLFAVLGHVYPIFFNYKGGKGVATALGALLGFYPLLGISVIFTWLLVAWRSRYSSLASIIAIGLAPLYAIFSAANRPACIPLCLMTALILYQHINNISRLLDGTETKINLKS